MDGNSNWSISFPTENEKHLLIIWWKCIIPISQTNNNKTRKKMENEKHNTGKKCLFHSRYLFFFFCILHKNFTHIFIFIIFTTHYYAIPYNRIFSSESNCLSHVHATIWKKGQYYIGSTPQSLESVLFHIHDKNIIMKQSWLMFIYFIFAFRKKKII